MAGALSLLLFLIAGLVGVYALARLRRPSPREARAEMSGKLVNLRAGTTHATWSGPDDGPVLVAIHGLSTPSYVFGPLIPFLTQIGYRVLTYDLYGRGQSDRVRGRQDADFFLRQLEDLLATEAVAGPVSLLGYSMGGAIATAYAARRPEQVENVILVAPAGQICNLGRFADFVTKTPILGDFLQELFGARVLRKGFAGVSFPDQAGEAIKARLLVDIGREGTLAAMLASQRGILSQDLRAEFRAIGRSGQRALAIWGGRDAIIPIRAMGRVTQLNRRVIQVVLEDADHGLIMTHPASIAEAIEDNL